MIGVVSIKNKKGFTLIEILAAITILGILSVVAIVSVNKVIQNAKERHYTTAESQMKLAGQSYVQQNRSVLPKVIGQTAKIPLKNLVDSNYIKKIKDYGKNDCDLTNSYVQVFKYSQTEYSYLAVLKCPDYETLNTQYSLKPNLDNSKLTGTGMKDVDQVLHIEITDESKLISYSYTIYRDNVEVYNSGSVSLPYFDKELHKQVSLKQYAPGRLKAVITATNIYGITATKTLSGEFTDKTGPKCVIAKADVDAKQWTRNEVKVTVGCDDEKGVGCTRDEFTKTFKNSTVNGIITIEDKAGNTTDCSVSVNIDKTAPTLVVNVYKRGSDGKKTGNVLKTITSNDANRSQTLDLSSLSTTGWLNKTSFGDGVYIEFTVTDGESTIAYEVKTNPDGLISTASNVNTMSSVKSGVTSGKNGNNNFTVTNDGYKILTVEAKDEIGNPVNVKIISPLDRVAPSTPSLTNPKENVWATADYNLALKSKDTLSGIESFQYTRKSDASSVTTDNSTGYVKISGSNAGQNVEKSVNQLINIEGDYTGYVRVCDVAGNCSGKSQTAIKLDKTVPTITLTNANDNKWATADYNLTIKSKDVISGIESIQYSRNANPTSVTGDIATGYAKIANSSEVKNKDKTVTQIINVEGDYKGSVRICDVAGNCTAASTTQIKLDKVAPDVPSVTNPQASGWTNANFNISVTSKDATSGIGSIQYSTNASSGFSAISGSNANPGVSKTINHTISTDGNYTGYYRVCDVAGNCSANSSTQIRLDKVAPNTPSLSFNGTNVTMSSSDALSGIAKFQYSASASGPFTTFNQLNKTSIVENITSAVYIRAVDNAGNASGTSLTKNCNRLGGTLTNDASKGWICLTGNTYVSKTCTGTRNCSQCCAYNYPCSNGWYCTTGWAGSQTYCTGWKDCETSYNYDCSYYSCPSGFTTYDSSRCYRAAD